MSLTEDTGLLELLDDAGWTTIRTDIGSVTIRRADGRLETHPDATFTQKCKGERVKTEFTVKAEPLADGDTLILDRHLIGSEGDATMKEMLAASPNCQFMARAVWDVQDDRTYVRVKDYMPLE